MEKTIIELEKEFKGTGEVSGHEYKQIRVSTSSYLYEVRSDGVLVCFEVFKRNLSPVCIDFENRIYSETEFKESYPKSTSFGVWAWAYFTLESALKKFYTL